MVLLCISLIVNDVVCLFILVDRLNLSFGSAWSNPSAYFSTVLSVFFLLTCIFLYILGMTPVCGICSNDLLPFCGLLFT